MSICREDASERFQYGWFKDLGIETRFKILIPVRGNLLQKQVVGELFPIHGSIAIGIDLHE